MVSFYQFFIHDSYHERNQTTEISLLFFLWNRCSDYFMGFVYPFFRMARFKSQPRIF